MGTNLLKLCPLKCSRDTIFFFLSHSNNIQNLIDILLFHTDNNSLFKQHKFYKNSCIFSSDKTLIPSQAYGNGHITCGHKFVIFCGGKERMPGTQSSSHSAGHSAYVWFSSILIQGTCNLYCHGGERASYQPVNTFVRDQRRCEGHGAKFPPELICLA